MYYHSRAAMNITWLTENRGDFVEVDIDVHDCRSPLGRVCFDLEYHHPGLPGVVSSTDISITSGILINMYYQSFLVGAAFRSTDFGLEASISLGCARVDIYHYKTTHGLAKSSDYTSQPRSNRLQNKGRDELCSRAVIRPSFVVRCRSLTVGCETCWPPPLYLTTNCLRHILRSVHVL